LVYVRAAILAHTGIRLRLKEVANYLVTENMISRQEAKRALFYGYESYSSYSNNNTAEPRQYLTKPIDNPMPVDQELNKWEPIEKEEFVEDE
jgi:hypothetical protein